MTQPLETLEKDGMRPSQIKAMIALRDESVDDVGSAIKEKPNRVSDTIHRKRRNERIRQKLCAHLGLSYEKLWGVAPAATSAQAAIAGAM